MTELLQGPVADRPISLLSVISGVIAVTTRVSDAVLLVRLRVPETAEAEAVAEVELG